MTSFEEINNKALSPKERIDQAFDMLRPPYKDEEQYYAALTYLSYRELDDSVDGSKVSLQLVGVPPPPDIKHPGLKVRWEISLRMVQIYINVKRDCIDKAQSDAQRIKQVFERDGWSLWPACVCNYLRSQLIWAQGLINKDHKGEAVYILKRAVENWKGCIYQTNFFSFPYRFTEMREDIIELQAMIFLLRDLGEIEDKREFDWMTPQKIFKAWRPEMQNAMYKLNPKWK
jgi:hypothetical protein